MECLIVKRILYMVSKLGGTKYKTDQSIFLPITIPDLIGKVYQNLLKSTLFAH